MLDNLEKTIEIKILSKEGYLKVEVTPKDFTVIM
jgi:hypothetical protein